MTDAVTETLVAILNNLPALPVQEVFGDLAKVLADGPAGKLEAPGNAILVAPPGAGKTTRAPLFLATQPWAEKQRIIVLEPRRVAARGAANHMARLLGERVGETVGLRVRFETRVSQKTRIEVVTEGVFTRMVLNDPSLENVAAVLFDEFHERSLDADLGLALALDVQSALRPDLRIIPMSATLDGAGLSAVMGDCPVLESKGRSFPIRHQYRPRKPDQRLEQAMADAILHALSTEPGSLLAFLPGQGEIHRTAGLLEGKIPRDVVLHKLYGAMSAGEQDAAVSPPEKGNRKVVLATAIAQTSLTIDGVTTVIDSGLARVPRLDANTGISRLETQRASLATITQRAGRAGRTAPGLAIRLWHESNNLGLPERDRPEILDADLTTLALDLLSWGVDDPAQLSFVDQPPKAAWKGAIDRLILIEAANQGDDGKKSDASRIQLTLKGRNISQLPLPPQLAAMVINAGAHGEAERAARLALLVQEKGLGGREPDLEYRLERLERSRGSSRETAILALAGRIARQVDGMPTMLSGKKAPADKRMSAGGILVLGLPDRIALMASGGRSGEPGGSDMIDYRLANGKRASIARSEPLARHDMLVIADLQGNSARPRITSACSLDRSLFETLFGDDILREREVSFNVDKGGLRASEVIRFKALEFSRRTVPVGPDDRADMAIARAIGTVGLKLLPMDDETRQLLSRMAFANRHLNDALTNNWPDVSDQYLAETAETWLLPFIPGVSSLHEIKPKVLQNALLGLLPPDLANNLNSFLPKSFIAPTGNKIRIRYEDEQAVVPVRAQELYGLDTHPLIGRNGAKRIPLTFELLSPAQRPIQTTRDLPGFWRGSWADVRTEMKGRYPKHIWPEEPHLAKPTTRAKPRGT